MTEDELEGAVVWRRSKSDVFAGESSGSFEAPVAEADAAFVIDAADDVVRTVVERQYERGEGPGTGPVAIGRYRQTQGVVRTIVVIAIQPGIECPLGLVEIAEGAVVEQLGLERSVEALVLAVALRMIGSAVPPAPRHVRSARQ